MMALIKNWWIWVFPLLAALVTGSLYYDYWQKRGPLIKIIFNDASSIEIEKTPIRFRGVTVGKVENVYLSKDSRQAIVFARLNRDVKNLAVQGTKFVVVQPQLDFEGVRGLETLLRGSYIRVEPGGGAATNVFRGFTGNEISNASTGVVHFRVLSRTAEALNPGDAIYFRGLKVGVISELRIAKTGQAVEITASIDRQHRRLIRKNTTFWQKVAVYAKAGLFGTEVKINSLESVLKGGISFATPDPAGPLAPANWEFFLEENPPKRWEKWIPEIPRF